MTTVEDGVARCWLRRWRRRGDGVVVKMMMVLRQFSYGSGVGDVDRDGVSTRLQLHEQALFCYYAAFLTSVEPKTYKDDLTEATSGIGIPNNGSFPICLTQQKPFLWVAVVVEKTVAGSWGWRWWGGCGVTLRWRGNDSGGGWCGAVLDAKMDAAW
nr:hypothetical protein [Tanacetum cinerariifolium]